MVTIPETKVFGPEWENVTDLYPRYVPLGHTDRGESGILYIHFLDLATNWVGWLIKTPGGAIRVCWEA